MSVKRRKDLTTARMNRIFAKKIADLYPWMHEIARRYCKNRVDVEDLVSETVFKMLKNRDKYNQDFDLKPWCMTVMKNTYANWHQRSTIITFHPFEDSYSSSVDDSTDYIELKNLFNHYSKTSLNIHCLELYAKGYSYEEISDLLGIKIGTVRSRIYNGRKMFKDILDS